ncbi:MAG: hypothetical protein EAZ97_10480, partial [Bacteroidetes bacterium]
QNMLGHLKPDSCQNQEFRNFYCGICANLRKDYGLPYTMLINNELSLVLQAIEPYQIWKNEETHCPASAFLVKKNIKNSFSVQKAAELSIFLAWIKATDSVADSPNLPKKFVKNRLEKQVKNIKISENLRQILNEYANLTRQNSTDFEKLRQYSGLLSEYLFREITLDLQIPPQNYDSLCRLFNKAGEGILLADHLIDFEEDLRKKQYNVIVANAKAKNTSFDQQKDLLMQEIRRLEIFVKEELNFLAKNNQVQFAQSFWSAWKNLQKKAAGLQISCHSTKVFGSYQFQSSCCGEYLGECCAQAACDLCCESCCVSSGLCSSCNCGSKNSQENKEGEDFKDGEKKVKE